MRQLPNGGDCTVGDDCESGQCTDGVCCNTACDGQCEICDAEGSVGACTPVTTPHDRAACAGSGACAGICDGNVGECSFPGEAVTCTDASCDAAVLTLARTCDGTGGCAAEKTQDCGTYGCDAAGGSCKTACSSDMDCASGAVCNPDTGQCAIAGASCKDASTLQLPDGSELSCAPYRCEAGACKAQCEDNADCAPEHECESERCVPSGDASLTEPPPSDGGQASGCACRVAGGNDRRQGGPAGALGLVIVLGALVGRRARPRSRAA